MKYRHLVKKDFADAIMSQDACNLSGIVHKFSTVMSRIWMEARERGKGTDWVNNHPICRLYAEQVAHLSGAGIPSNGQSWDKAWNECEEAIKNWEDEGENKCGQQLRP